MYYLLYWAVILGVMGWRWYTGTLTDRREAQVDDLKSFAHHLGERLDGDAGLGECASWLGARWLAGGWWPGAELVRWRLSGCSAGGSWHAVLSCNGSADGSPILPGCVRAGKGKDGSEPSSSEPDLEAGEGKAPAGAVSKAGSAILGGATTAGAPLVARTSPGDSVDSVGNGKQQVATAAP
jgi:hypothetical protein